MPARHFAIALLAAAAAGSAFAQGPSSHASDRAKAVARCDDCGTVVSVHQEKRKGEGGAVGVIGGAVVGGLVGHQFGGGTGKQLLTVGGAAAGAYAGNEVQKQVNSKKVWVTKVRMKDGSVRSFEQEPAPAWRAGNVVKVRGGGLSL